MHLLATPEIEEPAQRDSRLRAVAEVALIFLVFFIHAGGPAPDVNEAHYLSKAKHYWDASWCQNDFFCNTADAHQVFYWTFGWLSRWLSLPALAWCGRILTWGLLAVAWRSLARALVPGWFFGVLAAALFVTLNSRFHMAGEWVVGGVEAKGFAYALVWFGLAALVRARWTPALVLFGAATAFHVIVGGWSLVAAGVVWLAMADRPPLKQLVAPVAIACLLALIGVLPALALTRGVEPTAVAEANRIYVFVRLPHHLLPSSFPTSFVARFLLLVVALVALAWVGPQERRYQRLRAFVAASIGIAAIGMVLGLVAEVAPERAAGLLRFYWFRLADAMVPLGVAIFACAMLATWPVTRRVRQAALLALAIVAIAGDLGSTILERRANPRPRADASIANLDAWREVCAWAAAETPPGTVFLTPRLAQTFRWYAGRAEVVNRKDVPQDAPGIVEWWRRMEELYRSPPGSTFEWRESLAELGTEQLRELGAKYGAEYVITAAYPKLNLHRVGPPNPSFAVYRLSEDAMKSPVPAGFDHPASEGP